MLISLLDIVRSSLHVLVQSFELLALLINFCVDIFCHFVDVLHYVLYFIDLLLSLVNNIIQVIRLAYQLVTKDS